MTATPIGYNTVKRIKGKEAAGARAAKAGGEPAAMMGAAAHPPSVVAELLCESVESGATQKHRFSAPVSNDEGHALPGQA